MGLCDIEIDFDCISVTAKLSKESIQLFNRSLLRDITSLSAEKEFFVSLSFPVITSGDEVLKTLEFLQKNGFYY